MTFKETYEAPLFLAAGDFRTATGWLFRGSADLLGGSMV
ncbi:keywimysin-related RiPP [Streptomyces sichuanensis]|nr:keywimysin-related RiPP [Streptomyces sichuanensis]